MISASAKGRAEQIKFSEKSRQGRQTGERQKEDRHASGKERRPRRQSGEILQVVAASFPPNRADDRERADECDCVDAGVKQGRGKSFPTAGNDAEQSIAAMRDSGISEQATNIGLRERHEIAEQDRQRSQRGEHGRPTGDHGVPVGAAMDRSKTDEHNFPKHNERGDF